MKKGYIDIETFPAICYTWGMFNVNLSPDHIVQPGTTACWSGWLEGERTPRFFSVHHDGAETMIKECHKFLEEVDILIHYNGRKFDIPTLNKEFILWGLKPPSPFHQVDLYETVRKRFRFQSNKLDYVMDILGLSRKKQHKGLALWTGCMEGNEKDWRDMKAYNIQDVRILKELYKNVLPWIENHPNVSLHYPDTIERCTNCGSTHIHKKGVEHLATQSYHRYKCMDCGTNMRGRHTIVDPDKRKSVLTQSKII